jgi:hypothetical protein
MNRPNHPDITKNSANHFSVSDQEPPAQNTLSHTLSGLIDRSVNQDVLQRIQELDTTNPNTDEYENDPVPAKKNNPLRAKSGLYFRDLLKQPSKK